MEKCSCFEERIIKSYNPYSNNFEPITRTLCMGTKEREECSCGGDETKCDFYDYVRERGLKKLQTQLEDTQRKEVEADFYTSHRAFWVKTTNYISHSIPVYACSHCFAEESYCSNFCPECGYKMETCNRWRLK